VCECMLLSLLSPKLLGEEYDRDRERKYRENEESSSGMGSL